LTERPAVVVLLATYNGAEHLQSQIDSILCQTGVNVRIVARDDASNDATAGILDAYADQPGSRLEVIPCGEGGTGSPTGNFLKLIEAVQTGPGEYVAFADQDDVWFPDKLLRATRSLERAGAGGYSCDLLAYDADQAESAVIRKGGAEATSDHLFQGASAGCTYVFTGTAFAKIRFTVLKAGADRPEGASHDWLLYAATRALELGWTHEPIANLMYRQHGGNSYGAMQGFAGMKARFRMVRSRWYRTNVLWLSNVATSDRDKAILARVARLNLGDRVWLACHARQLRRRRKDQVLLAAAILSGAF
jgi:rhamnosyltransferase